MTTTWIKTDKHVFGTILREHKKDLEVHGTISAPEGDMRLGLSHPLMMTEYGFKRGDVPLIKIIDSKKSMDQTDWDSEHFIAVHSIED